MASMSPPSSPLFLCVDCGGTKTAAVICDADGTIVGRGTAGPSNIAYLPVPAFLRAVTDAVLRALAEAKHPFGSLPPSSSNNTPSSSPFPSAPFHSAWFGISGADSPSAIRSVTPALAALLHLPLDPASPTGTSPRLAVANDTHLLAAPVHDFPADGPGGVDHVVSVIGGTGSIAVSFARGAGEGGELTELARVGGWGWILGDEGGGYDVGREALRQILSASDHAQILRANANAGLSTSTATDSTATQALYPTPFTERVLARFGVSAGGGALDVFGGVYASDPLPSASPPSPVTPPSPTSKSHPKEKAPAPAPTDDDPASHLSMPREKRISSLPPLVFAAAFPSSTSSSPGSSTGTIEPAQDPLALNILRTCAAKLGAQAAALFGLPSPAHAHLPLPVLQDHSSIVAPSTSTSQHPPPSPAPILNPRRTLLTFGGSLVGVPAYRAMVVADLAARFRAHYQQSGQADVTEVLFPPDRVVFVDDAAAAGARGLASAWRREHGSGRV